MPGKASRQRRRERRQRARANTDPIRRREEPEVEAPRNRVNSMSPRTENTPTEPQNMSQTIDMTDLVDIDEGNIWQRVDRLTRRCHMLRACLSDAIATVDEFEKKSGEVISAGAARTMLEEGIEKTEDIEHEGDEIHANGFIDGHTEEELIEAIELQEKRLEEVTKFTSLVLALTWDRLP